MKTTEIVVLPLSGGGFQVQVNGEESAAFQSGGQACVAYARVLLEKKQLLTLIDDFAGYLCSKTPSEVNNLDCGMLRAMAEQLRNNAGISHETRRH